MPCTAARKKQNANNSLYKPAGVLFQLPGLLLASLAGIGAANFLKHPAPWLHGLTSGGKYTALQHACNTFQLSILKTLLHLCHPILLQLQVVSDLC